VAVVGDRRGLAVGAAARRGIAGLGAPLPEASPLSPLVAAAFSLRASAGCSLPSTFRSSWRSKRLTLAAVPAPYTPSTVVRMPALFRYLWAVLTSRPLSPIASVESPKRASATAGDISAIRPALTAHTRARRIVVLLNGTSLRQRFRG
jgi:hypothetical protein